MIIIASIIFALAVMLTIFSLFGFINYIRSKANKKQISEFQEALIFVTGTMTLGICFGECLVLFVKFIQ